MNKCWGSVKICNHILFNYYIKKKQLKIYNQIYGAQTVQKKENLSYVYYPMHSGWALNPEVTYSTPQSLYLTVLDEILFDRI